MSTETTVRRWPRGRWAWITGGGVAALTFLTALDLAQHYRAPLGGVLALGLARGFSLGLAWLRPRGSIIVSLVVTAVTAAVSAPATVEEPWPWPVTAVFGHSIVLAVVGARGIGRSKLLAWWSVTQVVGAAAMVAAPDRGSWSGLPTMAVFSAVAVVVAELLRSRADTSRRLAEQQVINRAERAERARLEERSRIARELHDVVAHHLSVVVVRADSASHRLGELPDKARAEFAAIAEDARASLTEMRRVLKVLRSAEAASDQPGPPSRPGPPPWIELAVTSRELGPQPGLAELPELVANTRRAGVDVRLATELSRGVDPAVERTAYRIVQEAISNAARHAPGAVVQVSVRASGNDLRLIVRNGAGRRGSPAPGSGHGLVGMRERVALVDGTLTAGPTPDGGFLVDAVLPGIRPGREEGPDGEQQRPGRR